MKIGQTQRTQKDGFFYIQNCESKFIDWILIANCIKDSIYWN